jgi:hypothetical protein
VTRIELLRTKIKTGEYRVEDRELAETLVTRWLEARAARAEERPVHALRARAA